MIRRRTFFAKCAAFVAGCAIGAGIERKAITAVPGIVSGVNDCLPIMHKRAVINPAWVNAKYEVVFFNQQRVNVGYPPRFTDGMEPVYPFLWNGEKSD